MVNYEPFNPTKHDPIQLMGQEFATEMTVSEPAFDNSDKFINYPLIWFDEKTKQPSFFSRERAEKEAKKYEERTGKTFKRYNSIETAVKAAEKRSKKGGASNIPLTKNKGGQIMDEQMEMAFIDDGLNKDPVSGNDIPSGSLAEEVRDDIPAMLSEGEYVVPADVLRFYGLKFFEDLRAQAKMGLARMEATGRIGGETDETPQAESNVLPFPIEELQTEEVVMDEPKDESMQSFDEGGDVESSEKREGTIKYWDGINESSIIDVFFLDDKPVSHSEASLANFVPYVPEIEEDTDEDEPETTVKKKKKYKDAFDKIAEVRGTTRAEVIKEANKLKTGEGFLADLSAAGKDIVSRISKGEALDEKGEKREKRDFTTAEIDTYLKQLKGFTKYNIGIDDFFTKLPVVGDIATIALAQQHKNVLASIENRLKDDKNLTEEQKTTYNQALAGEEGYTPARSFKIQALDKATNVVSNVAKEVSKKKKTKKRDMKRLNIDSKKYDEETKKIKGYGEAARSQAPISFVKGGLMSKKRRK